MITYNEWLPALLGSNGLPSYNGFRSNVNPGIANEFSTAAFRFGHSLLGDDVECGLDQALTPIGFVAAVTRCSQRGSGRLVRCGGHSS